MSDNTENGSENRTKIIGLVEERIIDWFVNGVPYAVRVRSGTRLGEQKDQIRNKSRPIGTDEMRMILAYLGINENSIRASDPVSGERVPKGTNPKTLGRPRPKMLEEMANDRFKIPVKEGRIL